jgi:LemA protein
MKKILMVLVVLAVIIIGYGVSVRNALVVMNENVDGGWAQVEAQYQRRFDLIPNLVETVKGVAKQEVAVFTAIAEARTRYSGATSVSEKVAATNQMESALARLMVIVENYPELKSQQNFLALQSQIEGTENRISVERTRFNDLVRTYNTKVKIFPTNIVASIFGFGEREYFQSTDGAEVAPAVNF